MTGVTAPSLAVFIDPTYPQFLENRLFALDDPELNRDDQLLPFARLREFLAARNVSLHTADYLDHATHRAPVNHYWSLGLTDRCDSVALRGDVELQGFVLLEPPLVAHRTYRHLPRLSRLFNTLYLHNVVGDGYCLSGVDTHKLRKLRVPQPYHRVSVHHWDRGERQNRIVAIAGNHRPPSPRNEHYSTRVIAIAALARHGAVDLFGKGWDRGWSRQSMYCAYWRHRAALMRVYQGSTPCKLATLSNYRFSLCFENSSLQGYLTEKIFDCFYAGTVPIYLGAPDIKNLIPAECYVDAREFDSWDSMWERIRGMSDAEWRRMREAGRGFVQGPQGSVYSDALPRMFADTLEIGKQQADANLSRTSTASLE